MNKETKNFPALVILVVQPAVSRMHSLIFGNDFSFLPEWFSRHFRDQHVETNITFGNADESLFVMPCHYNLN